MLKPAAPGQRPNLVDLRDEIEARKAEGTINSKAYLELIELMKRVSRSKIVNGLDSYKTVELEQSILEKLERALRNAQRDKDGVSQAAPNGSEEKEEKAISEEVFLAAHAVGMSPLKLATRFGVSVKQINELHNEFDVKPNKKSAPISDNPISAEELADLTTAESRRNARFKDVERSRVSVETRTMRIIWEITNDIQFLNTMIMQDLREAASKGNDLKYEDKTPIVRNFRGMKEKAAEIGQLYMSIGKSDDANKWIQIKNELSRKADELEEKPAFFVSDLAIYLMRLGRAMGIQ